MKIEEDYDLVANACGLASSLEWDYYPLHEVTPMHGLRVGERVDRDDLYAK
jgi:hypothetical protein